MRLKGIVSTPYALDDDTVAAIARRIGAQCGVEIDLEQRIDRDVIAGFTVTVGDMLYDYSARAQFKRMREELLRIRPDDERVTD